jgi:LTXXQ motif family protein
MSKFNIGMSVAVIALATALSAAAHADNPKKGAAAAPRAAAPHASAPAPRAAAPRASAPAPRAAAPRAAAPRAAAPRASAGPRNNAAISRSTASRSSARPTARSNVGRASNRTTGRGNRTVATPITPNTVGSRTQVNASRNAARNASPNDTRNAGRNASARTNAVRSALNARSGERASHNTSALRNTHTRALITAQAATAGWQRGREGGRGWWQHRHGGYGWVGPVFWPFAYHDVYDYALWGNGYEDSFWDYGYNDLYAGIFAPYSYDDLAGYLPQQATTSAYGTASPAPVSTSVATGPLAQMCGEDNGDIAGLPIDQVEQAIKPNDAQRVALDDLAHASAQAARNIKAGCPTEIALTAPSRLAAMQQRIEAMIAAVDTVQPPLEKFYGLLSDDQKARLTALGEDQRQSQAAATTTGSLPQSCGAQPGVLDWPTAEIDQSVIPTGAQRASLVALQNATAKAAGMLNASCPTDSPLTPPARLTAVGERLDTMLQAVKSVHLALNDFYGSLNDEQKAKFDAIGPQRTSQTDEPKTTQTEHRRRHSSNINSVIRHLIRSF